MSTHDSMGIVFKCLSKGAVDFLVKPVRKNELKNLWQHVWRRCHSVMSFLVRLLFIYFVNTVPNCFHLGNIGVFCLWEKLFILIRKLLFMPMLLGWTLNKKCIIMRFTCSDDSLFCVYGKISSVGHCYVEF